MVEVHHTITCLKTVKMEKQKRPIQVDSDQHILRVKNQFVLLLLVYTVFVLHVKTIDSGYTVCHL